MAAAITMGTRSPMTARRVTDAKLLAALRLLGPRFTTRELTLALAQVGITAFTQARYWLRHHAAGQPALIRVRERVKPIGKAGRPMIVYQVTEYGKKGVRQCEGAR